MIGKRIIGTVKRHPDGFGFFIPENKDLPDIYISKSYMQGIMSGDKVEVKISAGKNNLLRGQITKIIERAITHITGKANVKSANQAMVLDHSHSWGENINISFEGFDVKNADWVHAEIKTYPGHPKGFTGVVKSLIGTGQDLNNDNLRMLFEHQIPQKFSKETLAQVEEMNEVIDTKNFKHRKDLTDLPFITIDGITAQDFDDAIFVKKEQNGFKIFVAIADVSHYVKKKTSLDKEAYERGTSTYFPNFVNPMLPEKISNNLCSLKPHQNRLAFVAEIKTDGAGNVSSSKFYEAIICSHARVTYGQAQEVINKQVLMEAKSINENIFTSAELAQILIEKRIRQGSLDLDVPETQVTVNEAGETVDIIRVTRMFSHKMIEELMLLTNVVAAKTFLDLSKPYIFRIHEPPKTDSLEKLQSFMETLGYKKKLHGQGLQKKLTQALNFFAKSPKKNILNILTLRSMNQAKYSSERMGHFGLGFSDYTHFTSPIRRYPDLIVHRLIKSSLKIKGYELEPPTDIQTECTWLSACEQRSVKAERQLISIKKAKFMKTHLGKEFEGTISSVTKFGVFVLLRSYDVDGLIKIRDLSNHRLLFDEDRLRLIGKKSGLSYNVGDSISVQVAAVDENLGRIDFVPSQQEKPLKRKRTKESGQHQFKKKKPSKKRHKNQKDRKRIRKARV